VSSLSEGGYTSADKQLSNELAELDTANDTYVLPDLYVPLSAGAFRIRTGESSDSDVDMIDPNTVMQTTTASRSASPET